MTDIARSAIESRLADLRANHESGAQQLAAMEARMDELRRTMLRIAGAVQVLEEMLATMDGDGR